MVYAAFLIEFLRVWERKMIDPNKICMGCMRENHGEENCPHCGFSLKEYDEKRSPRALPVYTILNGKYLIGKVIGEGGFGITYLAFDLNLQISLAIKEYFPSSLVTRDTIGGKTENVSLLKRENASVYQRGLESFTDEAKNLAKFNDREGIVSVTNFFFENGTGYLVMEYVSGKSLKEVLEQRKTILSEQETLELMRPLLNSLIQVHRSGIIHRDISPDNIMLSDTGKVVLIDFGAARMSTGAETRTLTIVLKHGYAPVEQYQTKGHQGPFTDVYAVCATMYYMMSGQKPEAATDRVREDTLKTLEQLSREIPGMSVSSGVSQAIAKGLAVRAENRYQNIESLMADLYGLAKTHSSADEKYNVSGDPIKKNDRVSELHKKERCSHEAGNYAGRIAVLAAIFSLLAIAVAAAGMFFLEKTQEREITQEPINVVHMAGDKEERTVSLLSEPREELTSLTEVKVVMASISSSGQVDNGSENSPIVMFDGDTETVWKETITNKENAGETIEAAFDKEYEIKYMAFRLGNWQSLSVFHEYNRPEKLQISLGETGLEVGFPDNGLTEYYLEFDPPVSSSSLEIQTKGVYEGKSRGENCISDILVYGAEADD